MLKNLHSVNDTAMSFKVAKSLKKLLGVIHTAEADF